MDLFRMPPWYFAIRMAWLPKLCLMVLFIMTTRVLPKVWWLQLVMLPNKKNAQDAIHDKLFAESSTKIAEEARIKAEKATLIAESAVEAKQ